MNEDLLKKSDHELLFGLYEKVDDTRDEVKHLAENIVELTTSHEALRKNVYGNGGVGLFEKYNALNKDVIDIRKFLYWVFGGIGGLIGFLLFEIATGRADIAFK